MIVYLLLTFATTWACWYLAAAGDRAPLGIGGPLFLLGVFAPGILAVACTAASEGGSGVRRLLGRIARWAVAPRYYAFALAYLAVVKLAAAGVYRLAAGRWPAFGDTPVVLMVGAIAVSTWVQAAEEVGWRGYALPRLAARLGAPAASVAVGVVWAAWHLPLFVLPGTGSDGQSFPLYLVHVTAASAAMAWLYWRSGGSLLLTMLMHAAINNTTGLVPMVTAGAADPWSWRALPVAWIAAGISWAIAVPCLLALRRADLAALR
jgi:membrane protease YdiL (CAAX protease family)